MLAPNSVLNRSHLLQSPHEIGLYLAGFDSEVQEGTTLSIQLKFKPITHQSYQLQDRETWRLTEEERHRHSFFGRLISDPMDRGLIDVVTKPHHVVTNVYHQRSLDRWSLYIISFNTLQDLSDAP